MEEGWVYVLVNSSIPGMAKVGRTSRTPHARAAELSGVTGVATPFIVAYDQFFADCHAAERAVHAELDRRGCRVAPNREFFRAVPSDIIRLLMEVPDGTGQAPPPSASAGMAESLLDAGDRALFGLGDALQDTGEAVRCYKLAASRGSAAAYQRLGDVYVELFAAKPDRAGRRRAMLTLKEGARRGNFYCYGGMARIFAIEGHRANFDKAWHLFFTQAAGAAARGSVADPSPGGARASAPAGAYGNASYAGACSRYIGLCLETGAAPMFRTELRAASDAIIAHLLKELERARPDPVARAHVSAKLRWAYAALLPEPARHARRVLVGRTVRRWLAAGADPVAA